MMLLNSFNIPIPEKVITSDIIKRCSYDQMKNIFLIEESNKKIYVNSLIKNFLRSQNSYITDIIMYKKCSLIYEKCIQIEGNPAFKIEHIYFAISMNRYCEADKLLRSYYSSISLCGMFSKLRSICRHIEEKEKVLLLKRSP